MSERKWIFLCNNTRCRNKGKGAYASSAYAPGTGSFMQAAIIPRVHCAAG